MKSMTGYGACEDTAGGKRISVEIKSVNSRYSDITVKAPKLYGYLEAPVKKAAGLLTTRGKVDIFINIDSSLDETKDVEVNIALAQAYGEAVRNIALKTGTEGEVTALELALMPEVLTVREAKENQEEIVSRTLDVLKYAGEKYNEMRTAEGANMKADLEAHLDAIEKAVFEIEKQSPEIVRNYMAKIEARMKEILGAVPVDEARLLTEAALFADKVNVEEEIARLKSHISQMREMFESDLPVGRRMDFLIQEMNREINTTGSKCSDLKTARSVIDVKAEIEKLREQVQNIE